MAINRQSNRMNRLIHGINLLINDINWLINGVDRSIDREMAIDGKIIVY